MTDRRHVALLIETSRGYGRGLLRGISRYHREQGNWSIYFRPHGQGDLPPPWLCHWQGNGILARIGDRQIADAVQASSRSSERTRATKSACPT